MRNLLKRAVLCMMAMVMMLEFAACGGEKEPVETDAQTTTAAVSDTEAPEPESVSLDGKKVIFIGNSYVFYGNAVYYQYETLHTEADRVNDQGYFYQLCKAKGEEVSVTNWTFGSHSLDNYCHEECTNTVSACRGVNHFGELKDKYYDYVVVSGGRSESMPAETFLSNVQTIKDIFTEANPNVKFIYLCCSGSHNISVDRSLPVNVLNNLKKVEEMGYVIADWGKMVADIINGEVEVPGGTLEYNKNSFIISASEKDGFHPNQLSGYITALMTYCAITGESAVGQPYDFCVNKYKGDPHHFSNFIEDNYTYKNATTNYPEIFASEADMNGLQELVDRCLEEKAFREYNFTLE